MIDIFDLLKERKDIHINIEGRIYENTLTYSADYLEEFMSIIEANNDDVEITTYNVKFYPWNNAPSENVDYGLYSISRSSALDNLLAKFKINIHVTQDLYNKLKSCHDFIDYYTKGAIKIKHRERDFLAIDANHRYIRNSLLDDDGSVFAFTVLDGDGDREYGFGSFSHPQFEGDDE